MKTCRRGHEHNDKRCPVCRRAFDLANYVKRGQVYGDSGQTTGRPRKHPCATLMSDLDHIFAVQSRRVGETLARSDARMSARLREVAMDEGNTDPIVGLGAEELACEVLR